MWAVSCDDDTQTDNNRQSQLFLYVGWFSATCFGLTRSCHQGHKAQNRCYVRCVILFSHNVVRTVKYSENTPTNSFYMPTKCNRGFFCADLIACSTCFGHHYAHHQELKSIIQYLLPVVFRAVVFKLLVWGGAEGYVSGLQDVSVKQQLENHSTKYHREQPLYNTLELLMMGIVVPETCWASNKICNKNLCCI